MHINYRQIFKPSQENHLYNKTPYGNMKYALVLGALAGFSAAAVTTTLPKSSGSASSPTAIPVSGSYDGGMKRFERSRECQSMFKSLEV